MKDRKWITAFADEYAPELDEQIKGLKDCGISHIEIRNIDGKGIHSYTLDEVKKIKKKLDEAGIAVSAIGSPIGKIGILDDFEAHFATFCHVVNIADVLDCEYIRMFSFYIPEGSDPLHYRAEVLNRLNKLISYAKSHKKILLHENEKGIYGDIGSRCLDLFQELDCETFCCTFDFANFIECGESTMKAYEMLHPYITYLHIKDADKDKHIVPAGYGEGQIRDILSLLYQKGYEGFLSIEPHLTNFAGLEQLEQNTKKKQEKFSQKESFIIACKALEDILEELA